MEIDTSRNHLFLMQCENDLSLAFRYHMLKYLVEKPIRLRWNTMSLTGLAMQSVISVNGLNVLGMYDLDFLALRFSDVASLGRSQL